MVSFVCEYCQETLKKNKLDQHTNRCRYAQFTCIDCGTTFQGTSYRAHTSCISEDEKYQKNLYRGKKGKNNRNNNSNNNNNNNNNNKNNNNNNVQTKKLDLFSNKNATKNKKTEGEPENTISQLKKLMDNKKRAHEEEEKKETENKKQKKENNIKDLIKESIEKNVFEKKEISLKKLIKTVSKDVSKKTKDTKEKDVKKQVKDTINFIKSGDKIVLKF
ncbi:zf-LYAR-domain-containing protein [Neocallimastix lanati (nom. inval.)]|jgi:cell growth-regulating nucleolar protein|uniref:Zf-LYAR-domain-containing protein n=1 Tax=Neocallimastix californiae TaxID=1754190 RepID=A0A1Y2B7H9_9FUNG|nr:zf-LYAR-domain-containing protein [Neocallimastix sp. JGI-2020a]ORY30055.1 zf-LYAR-domain-containing protein [Neocallimastix californiae]|eukprot:ORY30055.1 zf-LYAR-domain-containing protein [Neocallimastix californiae]